VYLTRQDRSWWPQIAAQLDLEPVERVRRLTRPGAFDPADGLEALARVHALVIVIGEVAGALHGWPLVLGGDALEVCARPDAMDAALERLEATVALDGAYDLPSGGRLVVAALPTGTGGFGDLARGAEVVAVDGGELRVAGLLDLLRIADASRDLDARRHALAYQAVLDVQRARREASGTDGRSDAEKIEAWLSRQTPAA
jgi:hypothetical protein